MGNKICQRQVYRVKYPDEARPRLTAYAREFEIVDCSEAGLRFWLNGAPPPVSQVLTGQIRFGAGATADFSGFVVRVRDGFVALKFAKSLPSSLLMGEQRWLRERTAQATRASNDETATAESVQHT